MKRLCLLVLGWGLLIMAQTAQADWTPAKRLTWTSGLSFGPAVAIDSNDFIHIVWYDNTPGNYQIYYKRSTDGGTSWSANQRLTWSSLDCSSPALAVDSSDSLHVVWHGDTTGSSEVFYRRSDDAGETWSASKRLTWTSGISTHPDIAIDSSDSIHLVWEDQTPGNSEIYYRNSTDGGENWNMVKRLTWTSDDTSNPALAASSSGIVYAVWDDPIPGNGEIYGKRSTDGGETWSSVRRLTWTSGSSYDPDIAVSPPDSIHLVWAAEVPGDTEVFYQGSTDGGETWRPTRQLTWNTGSSGSVSAAVDSIHAVHIVFMDATPGDLEIHYRKSADGGVNWDPVQRLTWTSGNSYFPVIATDSANVAHIVWRDDISGNIEVYYKNGN